MAEIKADPESTWGATEEYKRQWQSKHGKAAAKASGSGPVSSSSSTELDEPAGNASQAVWADYAKSKGMDPDEADAAGRDELREAYGS